MEIKVTGCQRQIAFDTEKKRGYTCPNKQKKCKFLTDPLFKSVQKRVWKTQTQA